MHENLTQVLAGVAILAIGAQWVAWRLQWPAIVVLSVFGLVAGPLLGWLHPAQALGDLLHPIIRLCVAVILFEGGLTLHWHEFREAGSGVRRLSFPGLPVAWLLGSVAAHYVGALGWPVAILFGAIVVVTGPTVILPLLRHVGLRRRPASFLKWEGIINDPLGALLAVIVFQFLLSTGEGGSVADVFLGIVGGGLAAVALGFAVAWVTVAGFNRGWVPEFLKPPVLLLTVFAVYTVSNLVQAESGLLAATVMGMVLGNAGLADIEEIRRFKEYLSTLLVSTVFILLTADLDPAILTRLDVHSLALVLVLIFLVRPVSIVLSTIGSDMSWQERALVGWIAPRGIVAAAVAGVFGPELAAAGYPQAAELAPLVFLVILSTVVIHGFSFGLYARWLGLAASDRKGVLILGATPWSIELARTLDALGIYVLLSDSSWQRLRPARLGGLAYHYGEILSEHAEQQLDLSEIGYLLALTDNDAYNALVCSRFVSTLGRNKVYQLPTSADEQPRELKRTIRGRHLIGKDASYESLMRRFYQGWRFQKTRLTEEFAADRYYAELGEKSKPLVLLRASGALVFKTPDEELRPEPGDTVVSFMSPEVQRDRKAKNGRENGGSEASPEGGEPLPG